MLNSDEQKNWFVLYDSGYKGPFNIEQIELLYTSKQIGNSNLLWAEHLPQWSAIESLEDFTFEENIIGRPRYKAEIDENILLALQQIKIPFLSNELDFEISPIAQAAISNLAESLKVVIIGKTKNNGAKVLAVAFVFAGLLAMLYINSKSSEFKKFEELSTQENLALQKLSEGNFTSRGAEKSELFIKSPKSKEVILIFGTNLPKTTDVTIKLTAMSDTIIGILKNPIQLQFALINNVVRTPLKLSNGLDLPIGFYDIVVQNADRIILRKKVFIGDLNSAKYSNELADFHSKLSLQAKDEILELKQVLLTLDTQKNAVDASVEAFNNKKKTSSAMRVKNHLEWLNMQSQIATIINYWNLSENSKMYYVDLFRQLAVLEKNLMEYEKTAADLKTTPKWSESSEALNKAIARLRSNISYLENVLNQN